MLYYQKGGLVLALFILPCKSAHLPLKKEEDDMNEFTPWQSVGVFKFDDDIVKYQERLADWAFEPKDSYGDEYYKSNDGTRMISVHKGKIGSIFCYDTLIYQDTNLIGLTVHEFAQLLDTKPTGEPEEMDFEDDGYPQTIYDFDDIGVRVWEKKGKIVTIIVAGKDSYSDEPYED